MAYNNNNNNFQNMSEYNNSTRSLGEATAIGTPRVNPTENTDDVDSIRDAMAFHQHPYGQYVQPRHSMDEGESHSGSILSKRDSTSALTSAQHQQYGHSTYDPYYDGETTRHNTLTSDDPNAYGFENDYTDRDFPGGGKGARQSFTGESFMPDKRKRRSCCCSWPVCILITLIILIGLGVIGFFVLPRIPEVNVKNAIPASTPVLETNPPFINMNFTMVVEINNNKNYVPYKFNKIDVQVFDGAVENANPIATGTKLDYTLPPKRNDTIDFPLSVNYTGQSMNDPVIQDFVSACSPQVKKHTLLKLKVDVTLFVWGIDWIYKPKFSVPIPDMKCPNII